MEKKLQLKERKMNQIYFQNLKICRYITIPITIFELGKDDFTKNKEESKFCCDMAIAFKIKIVKKIFWHVGILCFKNNTENNFF